MFIKENKQLTRNFTNPISVHLGLNKSLSLYFTLIKYKRNLRLSWYNKKKKTCNSFWFNSASVFKNRYLIVSRFFTQKSKNIYDLRIDSYGTLYTYISSWGLNYGTKIFNLFTNPKYYYFQFAIFGQTLFMGAEEFSYVCHHLRLSTNYIIGTASGTYLRLISKKKSGILTFILPSNQRLLCSKYISYIVGRNENIFSNKMVLAKSGFKNKIKTFGKVRGIAKNPIDHPNGGNSNTKGSFRTPWGLIAKRNK